MPPAKPEPGRDPQMAQRTQVLNVAFALSSIVLFFTLSFMILADYDREWKKYQKTFAQMDATATEKQVQGAEGKIDATKLQQLKQDLAAGAQEVEIHRQAIAAADA